MPPRPFGLSLSKAGRACVVRRLRQAQPERVGVGRDEITKRRRDEGPKKRQVGRIGERPRPYIRQPRAGSASPLIAVLTSLFSLFSTLRR